MRSTVLALVEASHEYDLDDAIEEVMEPHLMSDLDIDEDVTEEIIDLYTVSQVIRIYDQRGADVTDIFGEYVLPQNLPEGYELRSSSADSVFPDAYSFAEAYGYFVIDNNGLDKYIYSQPYGYRQYSVDSLFYAKLTDGRYPDFFYPYKETAVVDKILEGAKPRVWIDYCDVYTNLYKWLNKDFTIKYKGSRYIPLKAFLLGPDKAEVVVRELHNPVQHRINVSSDCVTDYDEFFNFLYRLNQGGFPVKDLSYVRHGVINLDDQYDREEERESKTGDYFGYLREALHATPWFYKEFEFRMINHFTPRIDALVYLGGIFTIPNNNYMKCRNYIDSELLDNDFLNPDDLYLVAVNSYS